MNALRLVTASVLLLALAGCGSGPVSLMPDVTGKKLDLALAEMESAGFDDVDVEGGGLFGVLVESNWLVCEQSPAAGEPVTGDPSLTVDRSCGDEAAETDEYVYDGPDYEVVAADENQSAANLTQYWVVTGELDYSTDAYRDQLKLIIADIAHNEGTESYFAEIVTDEEIALAESPSSYEAFIAEHGANYAVNEIPNKEVTGWIASYSGGYDFTEGVASDDAFEILWWPYGSTEFENWKPES